MKLPKDTKQDRVFRAVSNNQPLPIELEAYFAVGEPNFQEQVETVIALNKNFQLNDVNPSNKNGFSCLMMKPFINKCRFESMTYHFLISNS